ncbi:MAG: PhoU domain-containing protein, partial [Gemmatimonadota bacterium]|nr:PhoU domain-containing protein [Gemmatimonadota bacterium]
MLKELLNLFRSDDALARMGQDFGTMVDLSYGLTLHAGRIFFGEEAEGEDGALELIHRDRKINKLERRIRKQVITHLTLGSHAGDVPYCLLLMGIVKDVERLGDYAKNLAEIHDEGGGPVPDDENGRELGAIRESVEQIFGEVNDVFASSDSETAIDLIWKGRAVGRRCDALIRATAASTYAAATTTSMVLGARYYKRIESHLLNVLSGIVMPLHKLN